MCFEEFYFSSIGFLSLTVDFAVSVVCEPHSGWTSGEAGGVEVALRSSSGKEILKSNTSRTRIK